MARFITLNLVNDQGTPVPWPGTPTQFELGTQESVVPVWIGVSQDGTDNQIYPITTSAQTILNSWPRLYQGVQISTVAGPDESPLEPGPNEYVYYNSLEEFNRLVAACCIAVRNEESPTPFSQEMLFGLGADAETACADDPYESFWVAGSANPNNMAGEQLYADDTLSSPQLFHPSIGFIAVNGNVYTFNPDEGMIIELVGPCE